MADQEEILLKSAAIILRKESEAILLQAEKLDNNFIRAVSLILSSSGRIAVCGMGKSGHIGRKIAATFASTGTPAFFIHPAEAGHGDLGMIGNDDIVLAISNSGETPELTSVMQYAQRHGIPIIAFTHKGNSLLARTADIVIILNYEKEACPIGCAPTTSTTLTLAMGDALAMALLEARGFTAREFNEYHPGGSLGQKLQLVGNIMHGEKELPLVSSCSLLPEILLEMTGKGFGCAGVLDENQNLQGIITDGDLRRHLNGGGGLEASAAQIMTSSPLVIERQCSVAKAINIMQKRAITSLFVLDEKKPIGIVHMHDCLRAC